MADDFFGEEEQQGQQKGSISTLPIDELEDAVRARINVKANLKSELASSVLAKAKSWLVNKQETILIYGLPKHGKTFAYCSVIADVINRGGRIYVISTDSGFARTAEAYFGNNIVKMSESIDVEHVYDIDGIRRYYNYVRKVLKKDDLLVIDLCSDVWEWAQIGFAEKICGGSIENFIAMAMADPAKFGLFEANKWDYIKALHKFVEDIIVRKPCNFVGVCNERTVDVEVKRGGTKVSQQLKELGLCDTRPGGYKLLPYKFETVIRIGMEDDKYFMQVFGDRGYRADFTKHFYDKNFYSKLLEWRKSQIR